MKKILISISVILTAIGCLAGGGSDVSYEVTGNAIGVTNVITTKKFSASLNSIYFEATALTTNSIVVVSPTETILTATVTAGDTIRPRVKLDGVDGAAITAYEEFVLVGEPLTITIIGIDGGTNDLKVVVKTDNK